MGRLAVRLKKHVFLCKITIICKRIYLFYLSMHTLKIFIVSAYSSFLLSISDAVNNELAIKTI